MSQYSASESSPSPVLLRSLYLRCGYCEAWAPSRTVFWFLEGFERARTRGTLTRCPQCQKATPSNEQTYRAFLENGECREGR